MDAIDRLMTRKEVADLLGFSVATLARRAWAGQDAPPFIKIGKTVRYRKSDVDAWIDRTTAASQPKKLRIEWQAVDDDGQAFGPVHVSHVGG